MDKELYKLAKTIIVSAKDKGVTIATAESCTGGWISKCLTDIPGSSLVYKGSLVAYANEVKENLLGVPKETIVKHGAVSGKTAAEMAKNCAQAFDVDLAISVTGIAGPGGGTADKPVGLVYMGLYIDGKIKTEEFRFEDDGRDGVRRAAVLQGMKLLSSSLRRKS